MAVAGLLRMRELDSYSDRNVKLLPVWHEYINVLRDYNDK
jgi:hypothetical protein